MAIRKSKIHILSLFAAVIIVVAFTSCNLSLWQDKDNDCNIKIERYDRLQSRYLTTGDFSALQSMNTSYPMETRMLIENILQIGTVDQPNINETLLKFFQDTTLQAILTEAETQYANTEDLSEELTKAFKALRKEIPEIPIPVFYTQIGALSQSIIVGDGKVGICLDKYLGREYPTYRKYYHDHQIESMTREYIVPDCLTFYLISLYPLGDFENVAQKNRDEHIGKIFWIVNKILQRTVYETAEVKNVDKYMKKHPKTTIPQIINLNSKSLNSEI